MIDLTLLRESPTCIIALIKKKDPSFDARLLVDLDRAFRNVQAEIEGLRHKKNELAKQARGGVTEELRIASIAVGKEITVKTIELEALERQFHEVYLACPNIPLEEVPEGNKESNKVIKHVGCKPSFSFPIKNHVQLGESLGWLDFQAAATIAGNNFALYKGEAVKLQYALTMLMLKNNMKHGYEPVLPSVLVNGTSLEVTGNLPKFKDDVYALKDDQLYLTPTAEVNLANMYRNHIFARDELPARMTAWTNCFRREAGGYGATERGLIRIHQFDKVELYTFCEPESAHDEQDRMIACAEDILKTLDLHYRVSLLAAQDCSFASAKTYDIEVWLPGQKEYYEVSSVSNCTDFQARRGLIRYKKYPASKSHLVYTLNASSLALPRLMVALMEVYQQEDGSIHIPNILRRSTLFS